MQSSSSCVEHKTVMDIYHDYTEQYRDLLIVLPMHEPSIFRGIGVSLLRPLIGSNVEIDVVALNWFADVRKQIAAAFKWLYKYFTSSSTVCIENSTFTVIIKLLHHWEIPVQMSSRMTMLLFLLFCSFSVLFRPLFSLEAVFRFSHRRLVRRCP